MHGEYLMEMVFSYDLNHGGFSIYTITTGYETLINQGLDTSNSLLISLKSNCLA